jgi:hypothetical protein
MRPKLFTYVTNRNENWRSLAAGMSRSLKKKKDIS